MEGVGVEITLKIKSAIKAKLMEIGAFVDDELPDYIMVMVANKRTKAQMNDDLSLFLGSNTHHFTSWLHSVLEQLKQVTLISQNVSKKNESGKRKISGGDSATETKKKKKDKERKDSCASINSSHGTDIEEKIKEELINEYSKDTAAAVETNSESSVKKKSSSESISKDSKESKSDSNFTEINSEESLDKEVFSKADVASTSAKKIKSSSSTSELPGVAEKTPAKEKEKEKVEEKKSSDTSKKSVDDDLDDSLSLELSSDENEYINIKNDDIFLSGDEDSLTCSYPSSNSSNSKLRTNESKSSSLRIGSRKISDSKDKTSRKDKVEKSKPTLHSKVEKSVSNRSLSSSRNRDHNLSSKQSYDSGSSSRRDQSSSKQSYETGNSSKRVFDARELLNRRRNTQNSSNDVSKEKEKPQEEKSNKSSSIFDRLSDKKSSMDSKHKAFPSSERSKVKEDVGISRAFLKSANLLSSSSSSNSHEKKTSSSDLKESKSSSSNQLKRQTINISQIANSERELLKSSQKPGVKKPVALSRSQIQTKTKEKSVENRLASRVVAIDPESDVEEIVTDVPSVVKVTPRPVIPASKAAPKNLILRAVAEAEKSVQSSPSRSDKDDESGEEDLVIVNQVEVTRVKDKEAVTALETTLQYLKQHGADPKDTSVIKYWLHFAKCESSDD